jgi:hypothetical protein
MKGKSSSSIPCRAIASSVNAGHVENARVGTDAGNALGKVPDAHARHYEVSNNQIDSACECLAAVFQPMTPSDSMA